MTNQSIHIFKVRLNGKWHLCPIYYSNEQFERIMRLVDGCMPYNIAAVHIGLGSLICNTHSVLAKMPIVHLDIEELFSTRLICPAKLKDKVRHCESKILRKTGDYVLAETSDEISRLYFVDGENCSYVTKYEVVPVHLKEAKEYMKRHRHNEVPGWHKFSVGIKCPLEDDFVGMVVASIPKSAAQAKNKQALEINRVCCDPRFANACSKLYALAIKAGQSLGYNFFITYTLITESGSSLRAAGFYQDGIVPASKHGWDQPSRPRKMPSKYPLGEKIRWIKKL